MLHNRYPNTYIEWCQDNTNTGTSEATKAKHYELMEAEAAAEQAHEDEYLAVWLGTLLSSIDYSWCERQPLERSQVCSDRITELLS